MIKPFVKFAGDQRGQTNLGWLESRHSFSFGEYHDPRRMSHGALRVLNDDHVAPGMGFGTHSHRDAEIFSYVISGQLEHRDSMGNGSVIKAGSVQYMSAGSGVQHSEFNPSKTEPVHFLQIWLLPNERGGAPRYAERVDVFPASGKDGLALLLSADGRDGSIAFRQSAEVSLGRLRSPGELHIPLLAETVCYLHVITGTLQAGAEILTAGDALETSGAPGEIVLRAEGPADFLLFQGL